MRMWLCMSASAGLLWACSASDDGGSVSGGQGDTDGGLGALDAGGGLTCAGASCGPGERCSAAMTCIADGSCAVDADCSDGKVCGKASKLCLPSGTCSVDGDCASGQACADAGGCVIGEGCGKSELSGVRPSPNVMILLDRSGSMDGDAGGDTRWNVAKKAIQTVTSRFDAEIRFGLATYSACLSGGCSAGAIVVPIGEANAGMVQGFLANKIDEGSDDGTAMSGGNVRYLCDSGDPETSTGKSLLALVGEPSLQDSGRENVVLLITDGEESGDCIDNDQDGQAGAAALLAQGLSVPTYVVGLGVNADSVNAIAVAGGTTMLLPANDEAQLTAALDQIASDVVSCDLVLDKQPEDPSQIFVFFNDEPTQIPRDDADGWVYDEANKTVRFQGASCDALKARTVSDVDVVFGCAAPAVQ